MSEEISSQKSLEVNLEAKLPQAKLNYDKTKRR